MFDVPGAASLHRLSVADPTAASLPLKDGLRSADRLVRHVAAIQLSRHHGAELPATAVRELLDTLIAVSRAGSERTLVAEYAAATDDGEDCRDLGQDIALAPACLPAGSADDAIVRLIDLWRRDRSFYEAALAAVALVFPVIKEPVESLSELQRAVSEALTDDEPVWTCCLDTASELECRGLPRTRDEVRSMLARESPAHRL